MNNYVVNQLLVSWISLYKNSVEQFTCWNSLLVMHGYNCKIGPGIRFILRKREKILSVSAIVIGKLGAPNCE